MTQTAAAQAPGGAPPAEAVDPTCVREILARHGRGRGALIAALQDLQDLYGYLPQEALKAVADETGRSLVDVYGIATFYRCFTLEPRGKHVICACLGTACHVRGAPRVVEELQRQLGIRAGQTTSDGQFTLETVNCLGACALGPVAVLDGRYHSKLSPSKVKPLLEAAKNGRDGRRDGGQVFPVVVSCPSCNHSLMDESFYIEGRPSIRMTMSFNHKHGWLRLSSIYGRYDVFSEYDIPRGAVLQLFCTHCHSELISSWECAACGAPMVQMMVRGGGVVRICSRRGCCGSPSHMLDLR